MTCGAPGHDTNGRYLCIRHGGVPSAEFVAALVGEGDGAARWPDRLPGRVEPTARIPEQSRDEPDLSDLPGLPDPFPPLEREERAGHDERYDRDEDDDEVIDDHPPVALRAFTWIFLTVTAVHIVLLVVDVLVLRREDAVLRLYAFDEHSLRDPGAQAVFALVDRVGSAVGIALWVTLLLFAVWFGVVGRVADRLGRDRRSVLRHWTYLGWRLALIPLVVYLFAEAARTEARPAERLAFVEDALAVNHTAIMFVSLRVVMLALLAGFVLVVWRRLNPPARDELLPF
ncbi:hypothetical protein ACPPVO_41685 [Dactylosporangium sp. McL0621]|uniref:hypothetical protein n=1 Tax=Dactylosporangium sp. McL0621 TaxID=3415678 RepID=UPI003CF28F0D